MIWFTLVSTGHERQKKTESIMATGTCVPLTLVHNPSPPLPLLSSWKKEGTPHQTWSQCPGSDLSVSMEGLTLALPLLFRETVKCSKSKLSKLDKDATRQSTQLYSSQEWHIDPVVNSLLVN